MHPTRGTVVKNLGPLIAILLVAGVGYVYFVGLPEKEGRGVPPVDPSNWWSDLSAQSWFGLAAGAAVIAGLGFWLWNKLPTPVKITLGVLLGIGLGYWAVTSL